MKQVLIDTRLLQDFLTGQSPRDRDAALLLELAYQQVLVLHCSSIGFYGLLPVLRANSSPEKALQALRDLKPLVQLVDVPVRMLDKVLEQSPAMQEAALLLSLALEMKDIAALVTAYPKEFKTKKISIQTPKEFLDAYNQMIHE